MNHDNESTPTDGAEMPHPESADKERIIDDRILRYQKRLRRLAAELSLAEARERREIASDLHDHIGQALAYVSQKVSVLQGNSIFSGMDDEFAEILSILDQAIRYTRDLTVEISPPVLYELGLPAAIDWLAERTLKKHNLEVTVSQSGFSGEIAEEMSVFIFKAIQELIANVVKHAGAGRADIQMNWGDGEIQIVVRDNGRGFDSTSYNAGLSRDNCFGLFSIRERLSSIGGSLAIDSSPGNGTRVSMVVPRGASNGDDDD